MYESKYLDPKADLTFKKVFGNHPDLLISLLNALLPLDESQQIEQVEFLPAELVPSSPLRKNTIVDVRCRDIKGRQFVAEMQMEWTNAFMKRVLFNASKAYISQAEEGFAYENLMPVYSLCLINDRFTDKPRFLHNFSIVCDKDTEMVIEGLSFTFVELPKFTPHTLMEKKMAVLWLRFLTEIDRRTKEAPSELLENPETSKALREVEKSAFTEAELLAYDKFWDDISTERTLMEGRYAEGRAEGRAEGMAEGQLKERRQNVERMQGRGFANEDIASILGLPLEWVEKV